MGEAVSRPAITPSDRLGLTCCLAIIIHAIIILGVTFASEDARQPHYDSMDIVLVQQRSKTPQEAKLLAQASLEGGGETVEELSPATPLPPPFPDKQPQVAAPPPRNSPPPQPAAEAAQKTKAETTDAKPADMRKLLAANAKTNPDASINTPKKQTPRASKAKPPGKKQQKPQPSATALLANSFKIASLSAEIRQRLEAKAKRPRRKFISASTHEYKYAAYMEAWRAKVERVGNLNYPEQARKRKLSGSLILDVALNPDGAINQITIRRSSGHKVLDDAAIRIVRLAAPYSPFPPSIAVETDILHITRTWQFLNNRGFR